MKVIIAGSRSFEGKLDWRQLDKILRKLDASNNQINLAECTEIVSGTAKGIDQTAEDWADAMGISVKRFPADWKNLDAPGAVIKTNYYGKYNARAGHDRNYKMGQYADAAIVVWDGKSSGSNNMKNIMKKLNKPITVIKVTKNDLL